MPCTDCVTDLDHCHEVLVVHLDGRYECAGGAACAGRRAVHGLVVTCDQLEPSAGCCPS